jgi:hypothetical protein
MERGKKRGTTTEKGRKENEKDFTGWFGHSATPPTFYEHTRTRPSSGRPSKNFTKEVGSTPLGHARLAKRLKENILKSCGTETQTFVFLDLFFYFIFGKTGARPERRPEIPVVEAYTDTGFRGEEKRGRRRFANLPGS